MRIFASAAVVLASAALLTLPVKADLASNLRHAPANPDGLVSVSTDYEAWRYFLTRKPFAEMYSQVLKEIAPDLEKHLGMSFQRDLMPMLGTHLNLAIYEDEIRSGKEVLPLLFIFDLKNTQGYPKLLQRFRDLAAKDQSKKLIETKYHGIPVYGFSSVRRTEGVPYMALSGKTLLFGSKNLVLKAIDSGQGKSPAALSDSRFKVAHDSLRAQKLWAYINPENVSTFFEVTAKTSKDKVKLDHDDAQMIENLDLYDSLGIGMDLNRNGLFFKTVARIKESGGDIQKRALMQDFARLWNDPNAPMRQLLHASPAQPMLFAGFNGLQLMDQSMMLFSAADPDGEAMMADIGKEFTHLTQLDFRKDVLRYSDGRSGVAVFYPENTKVFDRPPQMVFYLGVKDNAAFQQVLAQKLKLNLGPVDPSKPNQPDQIISFAEQATASYEGYPLYIADNNQTIQTLSESLFMRPSYTHVGDVWLFASNPDALKAGIDYLKGKRRSLLDNNYFKQLTQRYGIQANGGLMYIDLATAHQLIEFLGGEDSEVKALKPTLSAFKSIVAGGRFQGNIAEGMMIVDIDMDKVNFELLSKFFNQKGRIIADPTRRRPNNQPATPKPTPKPQLPHQIGL